MGGPSHVFGRDLQVDRADGWPPNPQPRVDRIPPTGRLTVNPRLDALWRLPEMGWAGRLETRLVIRSASSLFPRSLLSQARALGLPTGDQRAARAVATSMVRVVRWRKLQSVATR